MSEAYTCNRCELLFKGSAKLVFSIAISWEHPIRIDLCKECDTLVRKELHIK